MCEPVTTLLMLRNITSHHS